MLDRLLGRATLKDRIEELEEEVASLEGRLEGESERRREAVAARNEAEAEANRLEKRVEELEDRVARAESGEDVVDFRGEETLTGERVARIRERLASVECGREGAFSAYVAEGDDLPEAVREAFGERTPLVARAAPCLVYRDDTGLVAAALDPPVAPEPFTAWSDGFRVEREWLEPVGKYAFALVRTDTFALGVYDEGGRTSFEGFTSDVMGQHSKGGWSQARFERRRDEQVDAHLENVRAALDGVGDVDAVYVTGEKSLLAEFRDRADVTAPVDATGDPEDALGEAHADFWRVPLRLL